MLEMWYKKGFVCLVIVLFIAVAFAPSINANVSDLSVESELKYVVPSDEEPPICEFLRGRVEHYSILCEFCFEICGHFDDAGLTNIAYMFMYMALILQGFCVPFIAAMILFGCDIYT